MIDTAYSIFAAGAADDFAETWSESGEVGRHSADDTRADLSRLPFPVLMCHRKLL